MARKIRIREETKTFWDDPNADKVPFLPLKTPLKDCSLSQIVCYYTLWRGVRCAEMVFELLPPLLLLLWVVKMELFGCFIFMFAVIIWENRSRHDYYPHYPYTILATLSNLHSIHYILMKSTRPVSVTRGTLLSK